MGFCRFGRVACGVALLVLVSGWAHAAQRARTGEVRFEPAANEDSVPPQFRLAGHEFAFSQKFLITSSPAFELSKLTFPSPINTREEANNTVHCEYFRPLAPGKHPGVIVLHILGGDFELSRLFCRALAYRGTAALFVKMPYYGERRSPGSKTRMVSIDPHETVRGMTQAVLDIRRAAAWLAAQQEIDRDQLGIMGISLGGITSALAAEAEPRLTKVCLLLAGGDMGQIVWESKHLAGLRKNWTAAGGTQQSLVELMKAVDPVTYAGNVKGRRVLMLNALHDEIIPRACTESLWRALGQPEIVWWDAGHHTAARFMFQGLARTVDFFAAAKN